jgi:predicted nuclease of predicted toxin-antitoxin system
MVRLYMDAHIPGAITRGLRRRGVDVITAQEDSSDELPDPDLLDRASALGRVLFTHDDDLLAEAARRQSAGEPFAGVVYIHERRRHIRRCVEELELIAMASEPEEWVARVQYLPL